MFSFNKKKPLLKKGNVFGGGLKKAPQGGKANAKKATVKMSIAFSSVPKTTENKAQSDDVKTMFPVQVRKNDKSACSTSAHVVDFSWDCCIDIHYVSSYAGPASGC
jgi:hypothetical protein